MDGDITRGTTRGITGPAPDRAEPLERFARGFDASGTGGWDPPAARGITVERLLGVGSSALVWLVWWDSPAEPDWQLVDGFPPAAFALKVPRAHAAGRPPLHTVAAELQALDMLRHGHLVRAYGALETSQGLGLMLEPYSAGSLAGLLGSVGSVSLGEVVTVLTPIATALGALHQGGVAHGDVSPGNILLAADGKPALGDLADAVILGTPRSDTGTPGFAAPERELEGRLPQGADSATRREARAGLAPEADVYSLAAVAWFALTGSVPARGRGRAPLRSLRPELPESITLLLESALHGDPRLRPSAEDFAVELFRCAAPAALDLSPHVHEEVVPELPTLHGSDTGRRRWAPRFGAVALAALVFAGLWLSAGILTPTPTTTPAPASLTAQPAQEQSDESGSEDSLPEDPRPWQLLHHRDPVQAAEGLAALRTQALREVSREQVQRYTAAESPARTAELALIEGFTERGLTYQGAPLEISVSEERDPSGSDRQVQGLDRQTQRVAELRASVTATGLETGAPESQEVVLVLHRQDGKWLLHAVRELSSAGG
ncbi:protein kinase domain-containing protein [Nesterenkonia sp. DZ6]|uniref:protein kinase domain-containing protein n=1 Tax=Nesterenkonia sp. DZ6 TaxID=2901229 RepID=UPI001F4C531E|nr:protein kinase [Nesterenkonia sp. DZ6]MCH8561351.1 protein kinase [Nesterenkonia sp. DZ6]